MTIKFNLYDPVYIIPLYGDCTDPESGSDSILGYFVGWGCEDNLEPLCLVRLAEPTSISNSYGFSAYIDIVAIPPGLLIPAKWFVNIYKVEDVKNADYQRRTVIKRKSFYTMEDAKDFFNAMGERFKNPDFDITITNLPGTDFPSQAFYDEQKQQKSFLKRWRR